MNVFCETRESNTADDDAGNGGPAKSVETNSHSTQ